VDAETQRYVDAKVDAMKAQNDSRFSEVIFKLDAVNVKMDHAPKPLTMSQFLVGAGGALGVTLGVVFAILAYASDRFDGGLSAMAIKDQIATEQADRDAAQDSRLERVLDAIDRLPKAPSKP